MKFASFPKFALLFALAGALTISLSGCGSAVSNLGLTQGNWAFSASSTAALKTSSSLSFVVGGNLTQSGANLTGAMYVSQSLCITPQFVNFTGTVKGKDVTLTSASFGGQVITVTASGTTDSLTGTYTVTGDCADTGTVTAGKVPSISGTWSGTIPIGASGFNGNGIAVPTVTVAFSQAATASEDGTFALSGTLTYTNSGCAVTGTITNGNLAGNYIVSVNGSTDDGDDTFTYAGVSLNSLTAPTSMVGDYDDCNTSHNIQSVTLTKQQ